MLLGFFKSADDKKCNCKIVLFSDRIWLNKNGDAKLFRSFLVEIDKDSTQGLSEISQLVPVAHLLDLEDKSFTRLNQEFHLNNRGLAGRYKIKKTPQELEVPGVVPAALGYIDDDGFDDIKIFTGNSLSSKPFLGLTIVKCKFPQAIEPGDRLECRMSFSVTSLFENLLPGNRVPSYELKLTYFDRKHDEELKQIDAANSEIPVLPTIKPPLGGFDIFMYFPQTLKVGKCNPQGVVTSTNDQTHFDKKGKDFLRRYLLRGREALPKEKEFKAGQTPLTFECENITLPDTTADDIYELTERTKIQDENFEKLSKRVDEFTGNFIVSLKRFHKELRIGTWLTIIGVLIAIAALILAIISN